MMMAVKKRLASCPPAVIDATLLLSLSAVWGSSFIIIKVAVADVPPVTLSACRLMVAALVLLVVLKINKQQLPRDKKSWILAAIVGCSANGVPFSLISWAEKTIDAGLAAIIIATVPLVTTVMAHFFTQDEKITPRKIFGLIFGFMGVLMLIGPDALNGLGSVSFAQFAVLLAAICYAMSAIVIKKFPSHGLPMTTAMLVMSVPFILPMALIMETPVSLQFSSQGFLSILYLGIVPTALAGVMLLMVIRRRGATYLATSNYLVPIFGLVFGFLILGEVPVSAAVFAMGMIFFGIMLTNTTWLQKDRLQNK